MKGPFLAAMLAALISAPAMGQSSVGTIARGAYVCELPGDAAGRAGHEQAEQNFTIRNASRYDSAQGSGTYLRRGDRLVFSSGPRQGESYRVVSEGFLRRIGDGDTGRLRCVRQGR